ncbi:phage Gp37/Gp68 family protein [Sphingomonas sp. ID0503]|uniref:phage Gp37/Gp68 family protein n=1 Tax=Sphingomonas sp. ID0503 TaxID=3399691 RepID=UPI003AFB0396
MAETSTIEWTDATWNPVTGCSVISPGCKHCYAMKLAGTRLKNHPSREGLTIDTAAGPVWTGEVRVNEPAMLDPIRWKRPRRIFVCAHGDLFHENVLDSTIDRVFAVMGAAPQHTFQVLTKRAERMRAYFARVTADPAANWPLPNVWLGVSAEDQARANERVPQLLATPAARRFVSAEPLLGPINLHDAMWAGDGDPLADLTATIDWIIVGGESGLGARPMHPDWARSLRDQCVAAGVPFFFKQWGAWAPLQKARPALHGAAGMVAWKDGRIGFNLDGGEPGQHMFIGTKGITGRLLDGVQHDGMPA